MEPVPITVSVPFQTEVPALVIPAASPGPRPLIVALHGQGMRPRGFARHYRALLELDAHVAFARGIYPFELTGKEGPNPRKIGYGWYTYDGDPVHFRSELDRGAAHLGRLLDAIEDRLDVDPDRIALLGFSQGGYLGYYAAIRLAGRLAAYVACSCRLKHEELGPELSNPPRRIPILHVHGRHDEGVGFAAAESSVRALKENGWPATLHPYEGGHLLGPPEVTAIRKWLAATLMTQDS